MIRTLLRSKKGASSIMVMLMLVVLVVFGVAALTTALSNMRLGQKVVDWNSKYYKAEAIANERFAMIDNAVCGSSGSSEMQENIEALGFDVSVETAGDTVNIYYETWSEDIGISTKLSLDINDAGSLHAVRWEEIQK